MQTSWKLPNRLMALMAFALFLPVPTGQAEVIGNVAKVKNSLTGTAAGRTVKLRRGDGLLRNQRIRTGSNSSAHLKFRDATGLALNANATLVLNKFVFSGGGKASMVVNLTRGAFRFVSGQMPKAAYKIRTPTATMGIRGTMFEVFVGRGHTIVMLLRGSLRACNRGGQCRNLNQPCSIIRISRGGSIATSDRPNANILRGLPIGRALPFMINQSGVLNSMKISRSFANLCVQGLTPADPGGGGRGAPEGPPGPSDNGDHGEGEGDNDPK